MLVQRLTPARWRGVLVGVARQRHARRPGMAAEVGEAPFPSAV